MQKVYKLCDIEKVVIKKLKDLGYKYIYFDSDYFHKLKAGLKMPYLSNDSDILLDEDGEDIYVGFDIFFDFIKFPRVFRIDSLYLTNSIYFLD